ILMSLPYHNRTDYFGKLYRLSHFLPMYYTIQHGGIATQFWAKYTDHLPIEYKPGVRPNHTPDSNPQKFQLTHLAASHYPLRQSANGEDPNDTQRVRKSTRETVQQNAELVACEGLWCLYRLNVKRDTPATQVVAPAPTP